VVDAAGLHTELLQNLLQSHLHHQGSTCTVGAANQERLVIELSSHNYVFSFNLFAAVAQLLVNHIT
jgi:hypothetical protein